MKRVILGSFLMVFACWFIPAVSFAQSPTVVSVSPTQNALNVPTDAIITVTFDSDRDIVKSCG